LSIFIKKIALTTGQFLVIHFNLASPKTLHRPSAADNWTPPATLYCSSPGICIDQMKHRIPRLLWPGPDYCFPPWLSDLTCNSPFCCHFKGLLKICTPVYSNYFYI